MLVCCVFIKFHACQTKSNFGLMLNLSVVRGSPGGSLDRQHGLDFARYRQVWSLGAYGVQEIPTTIGLQRLLHRSHRRRSGASRPQLLARTRYRVSLRTAARFDCVFPLLKMERLQAHLSTGGEPTFVPSSVVDNKEYSFQMQVSRYFHLWAHRSGG